MQAYQNKNTNGMKRNYQRDKEGNIIVKLVSVDLRLTDFYYL